MIVNGFIKLCRICI